MWFEAHRWQSYLLSFDNDPRRSTLGRCDLVDSVTAGAALAVDVLCGCFWSQPAHALVACAQLLSLDSNQALNVRLAAVRGTPQLLTYTTSRTRRRQETVLGHGLK